LDPKPSAETLRALYDEDYFQADAVGNTDGYGDYASQETEYLRTCENEVKRIAKFVPSGRALDIGCGFGYFMQAAEAAGFDCYGVDISEAAVEKAAERFPGKVFAGTVDAVPELQGERFDIIFLSHVIEHIVEPVAYLADLRGRLAEGGVIVMVTPNINSVLSRLSRARWVSFKVPEHVVYFQPSTIRAAAERAGLDTVAIDSATQVYRIPFIASKLREFLDPVSRLIPPIERLMAVRSAMLRISSGSLRAICIRRDGIQMGASGPVPPDGSSLIRRRRTNSTDVKTANKTKTDNDR
jgi:2-polyprenyl-3-methyl-5-hydroxy-6-metoxy-1,4-benzoquinol methylase